jgi:hypothetical protein
MRKFQKFSLELGKCNNRKGQERFLEYLMTVIFGMLVLVAVSTMIRTFYTNALKTNIVQSLNQLALQVSNEIVKHHQYAKEVKMQPAVNSSVLLYETTLNLPRTISNRNYEIILATSNPFWISITVSNVSGVNMTPLTRTSGAKVVVRTTQDPVVSVERDIPNIDMDVEGIVQNGINATLRYYKFDSLNTVYNVVMLGESDIITKITSVG